jgi:DNA-binding transcriptional regulator YhcF (GntR family)
MSKIYLQLLQTPDECCESERILRFQGKTQEGKWIKAWDLLCQHLRVSSETANKALRWMHEQGIIGDSAFKSGIGTRIFLNRAASSIGVRQAQGGKKIW